MDKRNKYTNKKCCHKIEEGRLTIQEQLQLLSSAEEHMGPGVSVGFYALLFAILMGCNPIYVAGLDLEVSKGYAKTINGKVPIVNQGAKDHWTVVFEQVIKNDLRNNIFNYSLYNFEICNRMDRIL